jgi:hypothetical protein
VIVDITADQFPEITVPCIVTTDSHWHATFDQTIENTADFRLYDDWTRTRLETAYSHIVAHSRLP